jgi:hypothetical protein
MDLRRDYKFELHNTFPQKHRCFFASSGSRRLDENHNFGRGFPNAVWHLFSVRLEQRSSNFVFLTAHDQAKALLHRHPSVSPPPGNPGKMSLI